MLLLALVSFFVLFTQSHASPLDSFHHRLGILIRQTDTGSNVDNDNDTNTRMIGDLVQGATTPVGKSIQNILLRTELATSNDGNYNAPGPVKSNACRADPCCVWSYISSSMTSKFTPNGGGGNRCNDLARAAIRLGFHDAGTWSSQLAANGQDFGGADGSIILSGSEMNRTENKGLEDIVKMMITWKAQFNVSMADLIQFGATHAVVTCPLGPRIRFFAGRKESTRPAPNGLLPDARAAAQPLIDLFEDKTISAHELAALLGAHTCSTQKFFDTSKAGASQDSTPGVWDVLYYNETVENTPAKVVRFDSDIKLSQHPSISPEWNKFRLPNGIGQDHWNGDYASAYTRLSLLGVNNINQLQECSKVLPPHQSSIGYS